MGAALAALIAALMPGLEAAFGALLRGLNRPVTGEELPDTAEQRDARQRALQASRGFPGVNVPAVLLLAAIVAQAGCAGLSDAPRVILPRPAVPVRLADDIHGARILVRQPDGSLILCTGDLFAGSLVLCDPEDFPPGVLVEQQHIHRVPGK